MQTQIRSQQQPKKPIPIWNLLALLNNNTFIDGKGQQFKFEAVVKNKDTKQVIEEIPSVEKKEEERKSDLTIDESKIVESPTDEGDKIEENDKSPTDKIEESSTDEKSPDDENDIKMKIENQQPINIM